MYFAIMQTADDEQRRQIDWQLTHEPVSEPGAPSWWLGDEEAAVSSLAAVRALRARGS